MRLRDENKKTKERRQGSEKEELEMENATTRIQENLKEEGNGGGRRRKESLLCDRTMVSVSLSLFYLCG